jgi:hypothetical protein
MDDLTSADDQALEHVSDPSKNWKAFMHAGLTVDLQDSLKLPSRILKDEQK